MCVGKTYFILKCFNNLNDFIAIYFTIPVLPPVNLFLQFALEQKKFYYQYMM